ncbi:uncharacterized protein V1516DRAFT_682659 [Lipomyces oligophaga]|uniref:uncharacterized protein n=1 Tax=Lipomyces oligophaga TaxID=45792 RepID=UPI0034CD4AAE
MATLAHAHQQQQQHASDPHSPAQSSSSPTSPAPSTPPSHSSSQQALNPLNTLSMSLDSASSVVDSVFAVASHAFDPATHDGLLLAISRSSSPSLPQLAGSCPSSPSSPTPPERLPRQSPTPQDEVENMLRDIHPSSMHPTVLRRQPAVIFPSTTGTPVVSTSTPTQSPISLSPAPLSPSSSSASSPSPSSSPSLSPSQAPPTSLLYPPDLLFPLISPFPPIRAIRASQLNDALAQISRQNLPPTGHVFPWLHGLHPQNYYQQAFLNRDGAHANYTPNNFRNITLVKLGSQGTSLLVGSVSHREFLPDINSGKEGFLNLDPPEGVGLRNFSIQVAKIATLSDIVVYSKKGQPSENVLALAKRISMAQRYHRSITPGCPEFNTFVVVDPFKVFETSYPHLVAISSNGKWKDCARDFIYHERCEVINMSAASEITKGVFFGNARDAQLDGVDVGEKLIPCNSIDVEQSTVATKEYDSDTTYENSLGDEVMIEGDLGPKFDIYIECYASANIATRQYLDSIDSKFFQTETDIDFRSNLVHLEFPSSGSLPLGNLTDRDLDLFVDFCEWIYKHAQAGRKILLYCSDGYTETSLLGLSYLMYSSGVTAPQAYIDLHVKYCRAFFTFPADVVFLNHIQSRILMRSPVANDLQVGKSITLPTWFMSLDGSLPSRIFSHMYLGSLNHANNHGLLRELGIKRVLSIGEKINWRVVGESEECTELDPTLETVEGFSKIMYVDKVQDDGIDSLSRSIESCLDFLDEGYSKGEPTLVHCRVGVSRSATICIAEVMRREKMSLPRAYMYVRTRRLNVIIQPNLRFMYELMKWEEEEVRRRGGERALVDYRRDMEWAHLCREIAAMNKIYMV